MSEEIDQNETTPDELTLLKKRADVMGISYHPSIGIDKLKAKIEARKEAPVAEVKALSQEQELAAAGDNSAVFAESVPTVENTAPLIRVPRSETRAQKIQRLRKESGRLIRVRVACMNPNKKEWPGEIYTVSNSAVGTFRKYVPFNNDVGWHVPLIIFKHMQERQCQVFQSIRGPRGNTTRKGKLIKELAIEILDPLSFDELQELKEQQALNHSID